jgi:eukaryotic-like serine/threonine-protein kinase
MIDQLDHYKILERIGAGSLGEVYRARDTRLGRTVALKLPGPELQADRERCEALARDARAASVLSHPNIAALYEIADEGGQLFLVFEFVPGEPLKRVIAGRPLNTRRAVTLATQLADALADAHALDMVHGGMTSDTIMVTPKGNAKILDFGLARWTSRPVAGGLDHRADIRALGIVLVEMLTGKPPAPGAVSRGFSVPPELVDVVSKALEVRPEGGYEAAATCAADLRSVAAILDSRAAALEPSRVVPVRRDRGSRIWVIAAVVLALCVLAALWRLL